MQGTNTIQRAWVYFRNVLSVVIMFIMLIITLRMRCYCGKVSFLKRQQHLISFLFKIILWEQRRTKNSMCTVSPINNNISFEDWTNPSSKRCTITALRDVVLTSNHTRYVKIWRDCVKPNSKFMKFLLKQLFSSLYVCFISYVASTGYNKI